MAAVFRTLSFERDERGLLITLENNVKMVFILLTFCDRPGHIVIKPADYLAKPDPHAFLIPAVIQLALCVIRAPFYELFLKMIDLGFHTLIGRFYIDLFI